MASDPPAGEIAPGREPRRAVQAALVFTAAVLVFAPSLDGPWLFDDHRLIAENALVHGFDQWTRWFTQSFWETSWVAETGETSRRFWRPLVLASYALDWVVGHGSPVVFHATNLIVHGAAAVLVFATLRRWLGEGWPALVGALFWAVHPTKGESVAWITGRPDLLLTVGLLIALAGIAARARDRPWGLVVELGGAALAYGSKEHAVVLPLLAIGEALAQQGWPRPSAIDRRELARVIGPQIGLAILYLGARLWLLPFKAFEVAVGGPWPRFLAVVETYGRYAVSTVWPADLSMGGSLILLTEEGYVTSPLFVALGAASLLAVTGAIWRWRKRSEVIFAASLMPLLLLPVSNAVAVVNDVLTSPRFLYLPLLGAAFASSLALHDLGAKRVWRRRLLPVGLGVVALLAACAAVRALDFSDDRRFWSYELERNPRYVPALEFFVVEELRAGRPQSALRLSVHAFSTAAGTGSQAGAGPILQHTIDALLALTPDLDRQTLTELRQLVVDLRARRVATFAAPHRGLELRMPPESPATRTLMTRPIALVVYEARLASRLGDDERAIELTREVATTCPDCGEQRILVPVAARAGRFDLARQLEANLRRMLGAPQAESLDRYIAAAEERYRRALAAPPAMQAPLRAWFFAEVGAWGRAYRAARPAMETAGLDAADAMALAEIAYRAGDEATARELLSRALAPERIDAEIANWARQMRWVDAPREPGEALPAPAAAIVE